MEFLLTLRRRGIADQAVLKAMDEVPREYFVETSFVTSAYADQALPIACGQTISQPYVVAYMTEQLEVRPGHRVLEVGTGSGYQAAILSRLAREVVSVERYRTLADQARSLPVMVLPECRRGRLTIASLSPPRPKPSPRRCWPSLPTAAS
jgi:protein-L-isoaspartate(D-aspartate) O-methyltransferase